MLRRLFTRYPGTISVLLVQVVFLIDLSLPLGVASAVPYTFAVLLALTAQPRWFGPTIAIICGCLTMLKMGLLPDRGTTELWKVVANRCLALFSIGVTAYLGILRRSASLERQQAEESLRLHQAEVFHMNRLTGLGQLSAGLAHELNQPLAAIGLRAEILKRMSPDLSSESVTAIDEIISQSRRAGEIVRGIRRLARFESPGVDPIPIHETIQTVMTLHEGLFRSHNIHVDYTPNNPSLQTVGNRVQIEQVLFNLLQNAVEAIDQLQAEKQRIITIQTEIRGESVVVSVADSGVGIQNPARVFERFYTTKPAGVGLGLAISKSIVEAHGGTLQAVPSMRGAKFELALPLLKS